MIKNSTVIKRMVKDSWRPALIIVSVTGLISVTSFFANKYIGWDTDTVYFSLIGLWFLGTGLKWAYEMKRDQIAYEQKEMLRDIERKHL